MAMGNRTLRRNLASQTSATSRHSSADGLKATFNDVSTVAFELPKSAPSIIRKTLDRNQTAISLAGDVQGRNHVRNGCMTAANFQASLDTILQAEGGFANLAGDPGSYTNLGVTIGTLSEWLGHPATVADVQALTRDTVEPIYQKLFWEPSYCDELPSGVDLMIFDASVNSGVSRGLRLLQEALGVPANGVYGSATRAAVAAFQAPALIEQIAQVRIAFYRSLSTFPNFGRGWLNRVARTKAIALTLAGQPIATPSPLAPVVASLPAKTAQPILTPSQIAITAGTGAVIAAGTALAQANAMHIDLSPILIPLIQLAGLVLTGIVGWAATRFAAYAHVSTQSAQFQQILGAVDRGISYGASKAQAMAAQDASVDVTNTAQAQALSYVVSKMPGAMQSLGMTPQHVSDLILARLPPFTPAAVNA